MKPIQRSTQILAVLIAMLGLALCAPSLASAAFIRPFLRQIKEASPGATFSPGGLATDAEGDLWVGYGRRPPTLARFSSAEHENIFLESLQLVSPEEFSDLEATSLAIDHSTGSYYLASPRTNGSYGQVEVFSNSGKFVKNFGSLANDSSIHLAIDNSTGPSAGTVYALYQEETKEHTLRWVVGKFNSSGESTPFSGFASYIEANKITGTEKTELDDSRRPDTGGNITVDSHGNLYVVTDDYPSHAEYAVLEYGSNGIFKQAFTGQETPGIGGDHSEGGFGGSIEGVAVDPVNDHVLVSNSKNSEPPLGVVDEFASSGRFLDQITEAAPGHPLLSAAATTVDSHGDVYVVGSSDEVKAGLFVYGPGHFTPGLRLGEATQRRPGGALLNGFVNAEALANPENAGLTDCRFEYVTEAVFQASGFSNLSSGGEAPCTPAAAAIPKDESFHPVSAEITAHLTAGTLYRYRLRATVGGALGGSSETAALAFMVPAAPTVDSTSAANLSSTFADLRATIDPRGAATSYYFQYLTATEYTENGDSFAGPRIPAVIPAAPAAIGSGGLTGSSEEAVIQHVGGLQPSTAYDFRVVAESECEQVEHPGKRCLAEGPVTIFATLPRIAPGLPDDRAYELVTPPDKGGAADMFALPLLNGEFKNLDDGVASESGDAFLLRTEAAFGASPFSYENAYVLTRDPAQGKWNYVSLASPSLGVQSLTSLGYLFSPDFSKVAFTDNVGAAASETGARPTALLGSPGGPYTTLSVGQPEALLLGSEVAEETHVAGASRDLSDVVIESHNHALAPGAEKQVVGSHTLYDYRGGSECSLASSSCAVLSISPQGKVFSCGAVLGEAGQNGHSRNAVSADGSRVFFTAPDPGLTVGPGCWNGKATNAPQLYLRSGGETVEVSAPQAGAPEAGGRHPARFVGAAEDGSRVFFLTEGELTKDDAGIHDPELYEWQALASGACEESNAAYNPTSKGCLTRISDAEEGVPGKADASVNTVPAVSADGSVVYFTAYGKLAAGASTLPSTGTEAQPVNLYRYDTSDAETRYITTVASDDYADNGGCTGSSIGAEVALCPIADWHTTPDGRYLLFASQRELTGFSNAASHCEVPNTQGTPGPCSELYRYDSVTGALTCVSCNPDGAPPVSNALFTRSTGGTRETTAQSPPAISDDGSYVFFDTADALVPADTNGTLDVYEWHDGTVALISSGEDSGPSFFLGASADGSNVFFGTHARLVRSDTDTSGDIYDARICTAADPCLKPGVGETAQCEGDACQSPPPTPIDQTPASLTFAGAGDLVSEPALAPKKKVGPKKAAARCARGKKRSHGKCVKATRKRKKRATKASNERRTKR